MSAIHRRPGGHARDERQETAGADDRHHRAPIGAQHHRCSSRTRGIARTQNVAAIEHTEIDAYISTRKQTHGERPGPCPRGPLPSRATLVDRMSRKLHTQGGRGNLCEARKTIVEPVIGQIKQARGFRQFLLRGSREGARRMVARCARRTIS